MLVLSRNRDETIMIGDDVEITIVDVRGDRVRIGINAPRSIQVHRKEVYDAIKKENAEAANIQADDVAAFPRRPIASVPPPAHARETPRLAVADGHNGNGSAHTRSQPAPRPARARNPRRVAS